MAANPRLSLLVGLAALGAAAGCGGRPPLNVGNDGGAGQGVGGGGGGRTGGTGGVAGGSDGSGGAGTAPACHGVDETTCKATPGCIAEICPTCNGQFAFLDCYRRDETPPVCIAPPCDPLPTCNGLDESSCNSRGDCSVLSCPSCSGGRTFAGCVAQGGRPVSCPAIPCPPSVPCDTLDQTSCKTRSDCHPGFCPNCSGAQVFSVCLASNEAAACLATTCPQSSCTSLTDEMTCAARPDCHGLYCPDCKGGRTYLGCGGSDAVVACGGCPPTSGPCDMATSLLECDGRTDCHPVFGDLGVCNCTGAGCCIGFEFCADGAKATCTGTPACKGLAPSCGPSYVASHNAMCYDGCVLSSECAP